MALRKIMDREDPILRKKARTVDIIDDHIRMILDDMIETMRAHAGLGIAAPQVGILKRMFAVEVEGDFLEIINPVLVETSGSQKWEEGCLSIPKIYGMVNRPSYVKFEGLDREGREIIVEGEGLMAVALCHEYDHLNGILFTDGATEIRRGYDD